MPLSIDYTLAARELNGHDAPWPPRDGMTLWTRPDSLQGLNDGSDLALWRDASGNVAGLTQSNAALRPKVKHNAWGNLSSARFAGHQVLAGNQTLHSTSFSFFAVVWRTGVASWPVSQECIASGFTAPNYFIVQFRNDVTTGAISKPDLYAGAFDSSRPNAPYQTPAVANRASLRPTLIGLVGRPNGLTWMVGDQISTSPALPAFDATLTTFGMHVDLANFGLNGDLFELMMYNRPVSDRELSRIAGYFANQYGLGDDDQQLVFVGNSHTAGFQLHQGESFAQLVAPLVKSPRAVFTESVTGIKTTDLASSAAVAIDPYLDTNRYSRNTLFFWEGTNDLALNAQNQDYAGYATTCFNNIQAFCQARRAAGWKVIVATLLPRGNDVVAAKFEQGRQAVNSKLRAQWNTFADGLCDTGSVFFATDTSNLTNTKYFIDQIHPTAFGQRIIAEQCVMPALRARGVAR